MKRISFCKTLAPSPRLTLWVPLALSGAISLVWLGLVALAGA